MFKDKRIHFIGIGGIGMSGLAEVLNSMGYRISGSDICKTDITERLKTLGIKVSYTHDKVNIDPSDVKMVVFSAAIHPDNVEYKTALLFDIPIISRGEMLADIMRLKKNAVAVAGAHGKTTTSSLIFHILEASPYDCTAIIGGILVKKASNVSWGASDYLVAETDEHDGSFLKLAPSVSVVTNIDEEHMEYYPNLDALKTAFLEFIHKIPFYGFSVLCLDDKNVKSILPKVSCNKILYGLTEDADIFASNIKILDNSLSSPKVSFDVICSNKRLAPAGKIGNIKINTLGEHNVLNSLAAISVALGLGVRVDDIQKGLENFSGVKRRFEVKTTNQDFNLIEDYAHHPNEINAVIKTVKNIKKNRLIVVFQPHLYSRTQYFMNEFAEVLSKSDILIIMDIYPAREKPIPGVTSDKIIDIVKQKGHKKACYIKDQDSVFKYLSDTIQKDDLLLILGAGDVYKLSEKMGEINHETTQSRDGQIR